MRVVRGLTAGFKENSDFLAGAAHEGLRSSGVTREGPESGGSKDQRPRGAVLGTSTQLANISQMRWTLKPVV